MPLSENTQFVEFVLNLNHGLGSGGTRVRVVLDVSSESAYPENFSDTVYTKIQTALCEILDGQLQDPQIDSGNCTELHTVKAYGPTYNGS